ncbi:MAG: hypothetical protein IPJ13_22685 [Saprospiraceae bacterium]|nr:hypothetical protein [Saprospiraceae bacterium]
MYKYAILHSAAANKILLELNDPLDFDIPKQITDDTNGPVMILANLKLDPERDLALKLATYLFELDISFNVVAFLPFDFEGKSRKANAKLALQNMSQYARLTVPYDHQILKEKKGTQLIGETLDHMEMSAFYAMRTIQLYVDQYPSPTICTLSKTGFAFAVTMIGALNEALNDPFFESTLIEKDLKTLVVHIISSKDVEYSNTEILAYLSYFSEKIQIIRSIEPSLKSEFAVCVFSFY